jgi:hypothetical protein
MQAACAGVAIVVVLSAGVWMDPGDDLLTRLGYETYADLADEDISTKPSGWTGREATSDVEIAQVKGADLEGRDLRNADASGAFLVRANLSSADLRGARLGGADLRGADLRGANLRPSGAHPFVNQVTQAQLDKACGDALTQLPQGLTIRGCGLTAPFTSPSPQPGSS